MRQSVAINSNVFYEIQQIQGQSIEIKELQKNSTHKMKGCALQTLKIINELMIQNPKQLQKLKEIATHITKKCNNRTTPFILKIQLLFASIYKTDLVKINELNQMIQNKSLDESKALEIPKSNKNYFTFLTKTAPAKIVWDNLPWTALTKQDKKLAFDPNCLPQEIWNLIFHYLDIEDRSQVEQVCRNFKVLIHQLNKIYPSIPLKHRQHIAKINVQTYIKICQETQKNGGGSGDTILFRLNLKNYHLHPINDTENGPDQSQVLTYGVGSTGGRGRVSRIDPVKGLEEREFRIALYQPNVEDSKQFVKPELDKKTFLIIKDLFIVLESLPRIIERAHHNQALAEYSWEDLESEANKAIAKLS